MARLNIPAVLVVSVLGTGSVVGVATCTDDDDEPTECTVEGDCPGDGRLCIEDDGTHTPCCPTCPVMGSCPTGCVLDLPPI